MRGTPSPTQSEVLRRLEHGKRLVRTKGGFWSTEDTPKDAGGIPTWSVDIRTVRALEKLGLLVRTFEFSEEWRDPRIKWRVA